jgi:hypothetical protein
VELCCIECLPDFRCQFDSANGDRRVVESFESKHLPNPLFHSPMLLFDEIVQVLARSHPPRGSSPVSFTSRTARSDAAKAVSVILAGVRLLLIALRRKGLGNGHIAL